MEIKLWQATLRISCPGTSVTDEELTGDTIFRHGMAESAGKFVKALYGKALDPYQQAARKARKDYHRMTFEGIGDIRLVVVSEREKFLTTMGAHEAKLKDAADDFITGFEAILEEERIEKNGAFKVEDYPTKGQLAASFGVRYAVMPMPEPTQFLKDAMTGDLSSKMAQEYAARLEATQRQISDQVLSSLINLISETAESLAGDGPIVDSENRKGPFAKLNEYLERIPSLNICNDPKITALHAACKEKLSYSADTIRASKTTRSLVAARAQNIAMTLGKMGRKVKLD